MFGSFKKTVAVSLTALTLGLGIAATATPAAADYWPGGYGHGWGYGHGGGYGQNWAYGHWNGYQNYASGGGCGPYNDCRPWRHGPWPVSGGYAPSHGPVGYNYGSGYAGNAQGSSVPVGYGHGNNQGSSVPVGHGYNYAHGYAQPQPQAPVFIDAHPSATTNGAMAPTAPTPVNNAQTPVSNVYGSAVTQDNVLDVVDADGDMAPTVVDSAPMATPTGPTADARVSAQTPVGGVNVPTVDAAANAPAPAAGNIVPTLDAGGNVQTPVAGANVPPVDAGANVQPPAIGNNVPTVVAANSAPTTAPNAPGAACTVVFKPVFDDAGATIGFHALNSCK